MTCSLYVSPRYAYMFVEVAMLWRQDVLEIIGMSVPAYDALANRGLLPFKIAGGASGRYDETHLLKLGLFRALAAAGATQAVAAQAVGKGFNDFDSFAADAKASSNCAFMFGVGAFDDEGELDWLPLFGLWRPGRPMKLGTIRGRSLDLHPPARMTLVDATNVFSQLLSSARSAGRSGQELEKWASHFNARRK